MRRARQLLSLLLLIQTVLGSSSIIDKTGKVQFHLSQPLEDDHATPFSHTKAVENTLSCFVTGPPVPSGLTQTLSNVVTTSEGSEATITVLGSCPVGHELNFASKTVACSLASGWAESPFCVPVTCSNIFGSGITSTNCTGPTSTYGDVCALECSEPDPTGSAYATCSSTGQMISDYSCSQTFISTCGAGGYNGLGAVGDTTNSLRPDPAKDLSASWGSVKLVAAGYQSLCAVSDDNKLKCMGYNSQLQTADSATNPTTTVTTNPSWDAIAVSQTAVQLESGVSFFGIRTSLGEVYLWGQGSNGQLLQGADFSNYYSLKKAPLPAGRTATLLTVSTHSTMIALDNGEFFGGGYNLEKQLTDGDTDLQATILDLTLPAGEAVDSTQMTHSHLVVVSKTKKVYGRSHNYFNAYCGTGSTAVLQKITDSADNGVHGHVDNAFCSRHMCMFVTDQGRIYACTHDADAIPGHAGIITTPVNIASTINAKCDAGKIVSKFWTNREGLYFGGFGCKDNTLFGFADNADGDITCQSSYTKGQISVVMEVGSGVIQHVSSYASSTAVLHS